MLRVRIVAFSLLLLALPACNTASEPGAGDGTAGTKSEKKTATTPDAKDAKAQGKTSSKVASDGPHLVRVSSLEPRAVEERLPCTSHIEAFHSVDVNAQARGQLLEVLVEEGQIVKKDDVLFRIDDREAVLNLESAKNRAKNAEDQQRDAELSVDDANDKVAKAKIEFRQAERSLERRKASAKQDLASASQLEDAQLSYDQAQNAIDLAENALAVAKHGLVKAQTELESAQIQVKIQKRLLEDYTVRAPITGVVPELMVRGGEWLAAQQMLCQLVAHDQLVLNLKRPQKELGVLRTKQRVDVRVDAYKGTTFEGQIDFVSPIVDPETGTFRARVRLGADAIGKLLPGMFCRAWIVTGTSHDALMIPKEAIVYDAQTPFAFVVRDGKAERISIQRGIDLKDAVEARNVAPTARPGSFTRGDKIVVVGVDGLSEGGVKVQVVKS